MTGMRRGEVLGLRWSDIDFEMNRLSVRNTLVSVNYRLVESIPKTHKARVIDLDADTLQSLREHKVRQLDEHKEWGEDYEENNLVFPRENGSPLHPDGYTQRFELEVKHSGLRRIRLHDLRHTHATIALRAGIPVKVISERLGHETPAFTLKQYAHVIPGMQAEAAEKIASLVANVSI
jgi:integrase